MSVAIHEQVRLDGGAVRPAGAMNFSAWRVMVASVVLVGTAAAVVALLVAEMAK